jgi:hypothetical protein
MCGAPGVCLYVSSFTPFRNVNRIRSGIGRIRSELIELLVYLMEGYQTSIYAGCGLSGLATRPLHLPLKYSSAYTAQYQLTNRSSRSSSNIQGCTIPIPSFKCFKLQLRQPLKKYSSITQIIDARMQLGFESPCHLLWVR